MLVIIVMANKDLLHIKNKTYFVVLSAVSTTHIIAVLEVGSGGVAPSCIGDQGYYPGKILKC